MKFWLLTSIMRSEQDVLRAVARRRREWRFVLAWLDDLTAITDAQDRSKLDFVLPDRFVQAALGRSKLRFYLSRDYWLRSKRHSFWDRRLSAIESFRKFGGEVMEEALEYGSVNVRDR